jgi:hypothetical protein
MANMRGRLSLLPLWLTLAACGASTSPTPTLSTISVTCSATVAVGQTASCSATAHFANGSASPESSGVTWQSSNVAVASVGQASGMVTGVRIGASVIITATFQGVSGTATIIVTAPLTATLQSGCPAFGEVCLANLETDLFFTTSASATASYSVAFGDGQTCGPMLASCNAQLQTHIPGPNVQWFPHTYAAGSFTATLTIADGGSQSTATATVSVVTLSGTWIAGSGTDGCTGRRTLQLTQTGTSLNGTYTSPSGSMSGATGMIGGQAFVNAIGPSVRDVVINVPGPGLQFFGQTFNGGNGVSADASTMLLPITQGDVSCGGPTLAFKRQ